ncbi:tetratricopeptide repeat protein [Psychromonas sp. RZ22]|uniref:YfgM family protein n=1 Tax=Psychromonas algarum TaxID=2555643 RepID=UPI0010677B87|nr:tetratricopeptide repeat protein [Psychromonas sp. RZ22]TEW54896.1 tetratricopeptide repeat protein [Psychromonas sp. RZ22]
MVDIIEGYETEEQQVDAIKRWWNDNGTMLIVAIVVGFAGLWGWRYYGESVVTSQEQASTAFDATLVKFQADSAVKGAAEMQAFVDANKDSNYATLASLLLAKQAVAENDFALAKTQLEALLKANTYEPLMPVIQLRLARVEAQLGEFDSAIALLDKISAEGFLVKSNQTKGAIYLQKGDLESARGAFQAAVDASKGRVDPILQLQLNDLAVAKAEVAAAPKLDAAQ